jgi:acetyltransferase-like isoleucine patch superfamily enzyme
MTSTLTNLVRSLMGVAVRRRCSVQVGRESQVDWWRLRSLRGGRLEIGDSSIIHCKINFDEPHGRVSIGSRTYIGASHIVCHTAINIGSDVLISWGVTIVDHDSHSVFWPERAQDVSRWLRGEKSWQHVPVAPVTVSDKAWIGFGATVLKGVVIGEGAVVGAGSVVTRGVAPYTLVAGNPARIVREITTPKSL